MNFTTPPYLSQNISVQRVMLQVLAALLPGIVAYVWLIGPAILVQIAIATAVCLLAEALMLKVLKKPLGLFLGDGSALVTAWLIALSFPPLGPWWLIVVGCLFAIVIASQFVGLCFRSGIFAFRLECGGSLREREPGADVGRRPPGRELLE